MLAAGWVDFLNEHRSPWISFSMALAHPYGNQIYGVPFQRAPFASVGAMHDKGKAERCARGCLMRFPGHPVRHVYSEMNSTEVNVAHCQETVYRELQYLQIWIF